MFQNIGDEEKIEKVFFIYLQSHLCLPEDTWETLAWQPEDLCYCI